MMANNRIRVLVVDDEALARNGILHLLASDPEIVVVGEAADGESPVHAIRDLAPDLVLLDVQMPGRSGVDVVRAVGPADMPAVIFITAHDSFAIAAFEIDAIDYLLKPFDDDRFHAAIGRAKRSLRSVELNDLRRRLSRLVDPEHAEAESGRAPDAREFTDRLVVKSAGRSHFIRVADIDWVEAADYYSRLHVGGKTHLIRETMAALEARLDPRRFFRVHRSAIVNLDRIAEMQPYFRGDYVMILLDGTRLKLTRSRRAKLESILKQEL